jgi:hypothetical protein
VSPLHQPYQPISILGRVDQVAQFIPRGDDVFVGVIVLGVIAHQFDDLVDEL